MGGEHEILSKGQILGKTYRVEEPLSSGGYAIVYAAERIDDGLPVVVKALRQNAPSADPAALERFIKEAAIVARFRHPNIVRTFDIGQTRGGVIYMVMERLFGMPLSQVMYRRPAPEEETRYVLRKILRGLVEAHSQGVVHRDLKPSNVFICDVDGGQQIKLIDFGFVKTFDDDEDTNPLALPGNMLQGLGSHHKRFEGPLTLAGQRVGTPGYIAPEMIGLEGEVAPALGPGVDLYAVGVMGYELLTGAPAFAGEGIQRVLAQVREELVKPPRGVGKSPMLPLIRRLMARDPSKRPTTAIKALHELEALFR